MDIQAFEKLLETYGTSSSRWPDEVRDVALAFQESEAGQTVIRRHAAIDRNLDKFVVSPDLVRLEARILSRVRATRTLAERLIDWLLPDPGEPRSFLRPALAASLPLLLGVVLGSYVPTDVATDAGWTEQETLVLMGLAIEDDTMESLP